LGGDNITLRFNMRVSNEVMRNILDHVAQGEDSGKTLSACALASKQLAKLVRPILYGSRVIEVKVSDRIDPLGAHKTRIYTVYLDAEAQAWPSRPHLWRYVRHLKIILAAKGPREGCSSGELAIPLSALSKYLDPGHRLTSLALDLDTLGLHDQAAASIVTKHFTLMLAKHATLLDHLAITTRDMENELPFREIVQGMSNLRHLELNMEVESTIETQLTLPLISLSLRFEPRDDDEAEILSNLVSGSHKTLKSLYIRGHPAQDFDFQVLTSLNHFTFEANDSHDRQRYDGPMWETSNFGTGWPQLKFLPLQSFGLLHSESSGYQELLMRCLLPHLPPSIVELTLTMPEMGHLSSILSFYFKRNLHSIYLVTKNAQAKWTPENSAIVFYQARDAGIQIFVDGKLQE
jgi:hypothetical protein